MLHKLSNTSFFRLSFACWLTRRQSSSSNKLSKRLSSGRQEDYDNYTRLRMNDFNFKNKNVFRLRFSKCHSGVLVPLQICKTQTV